MWLAEGVQHVVNIPKLATVIQIGKSMGDYATIRLPKKVYWNRILGRNEQLYIRTAPKGAES
jgi:hypothetical protein